MEPILHRWSHSGAPNDVTPCLVNSTNCSEGYSSCLPINSKYALLVPQKRSDPIHSAGAALKPIRSELSRIEHFVCSSVPTIWCNKQVFAAFSELVRQEYNTRGTTWDLGQVVICYKPNLWQSALAQLKRKTVTVTWNSHMQACTSYATVTCEPYV